MNQSASQASQKHRTSIAGVVAELEKESSYMSSMGELGEVGQMPCAHANECPTLYLIAI